jgi:hypothetical protein
LGREQVFVVLDGVGCQAVLPLWPERAVSNLSRRRLFVLGKGDAVALQCPWVVNEREGFCVSFRFSRTGVSRQAVEGDASAPRSRRVMKKIISKVTERLIVEIYLMTVQ